MRELRELAEDDDIDGRRQRWDEQGPSDPEERLFVADDDVTPDEPQCDLAVVPQLPDVEVRPAFRRSDDRDSPLGLEVALDVLGDGSRSLGLG